MTCFVDFVGLWLVCVGVFVFVGLLVCLILVCVIFYYALFVGLCMSFINLTWVENWFGGYWDCLFNFLVVITLTYGLCFVISW